MYGEQVPDTSGNLLEDEFLGYYSLKHDKMVLTVHLYYIVIIVWL